MSDEATNTGRIRLFTIGFTKKSAKEFFTTLEKTAVRRLIDIRLNNVSQLAGFTKRDDLEFFLNRVCGIEYLHVPEMAPTEDILTAYKKKLIDWSSYEKQFNQLIAQRKIEDLLPLEQLDMACLLCSEPTADKCHRRLVAEYLQRRMSELRVAHLA